MKTPHNQLCEACGGCTRSPVASQIAVVITGPPGFTWWHFVHGADISRSYDLAGVHSTEPRLADVSILSAPGCRAGQQIILQQLPYVVIVPQHTCYSAVWHKLCCIYGAGAPLQGHVSFSCSQMHGSSSLKLWRPVKKVIERDGGTLVSTRTLYMGSLCQVSLHSCLKQAHKGEWEFKWPPGFEWMVPWFAHTPGMSFYSGNIQ